MAETVCSSFLHVDCCRRSTRVHATYNEEEMQPRTFFAWLLSAYLGKHISADIQVRYLPSLVSTWAIKSQALAHAMSTLVPSLALGAHHMAQRHPAECTSRSRSARLDCAS